MITPGPWMVNGRTAAGWRVDAVGAEREGADFLRSPDAIIPGESDAKAVAALPDLIRALAGLLHAVRHWSGPAPRAVVAAGLTAEAALQRAGVDL